jgi:glycosyltransferase involved in cell wall biosynthesis
MPGPSTGLWRDRFIVFSGGKFEFRKAQDVVAVAFKRFHEKHPDSLLLTCWQTLLPQDPEPFRMAGHCQAMPQVDSSKGILTTPWLLELGLPQGSFLELPYTPNMLMPSLLRECSAAIFPNRCEGGTNLVAMEAMACGVPTVVANNTGQNDLVELLDFPAFGSYQKVKAPPTHASVEDWGETDPDDVVEALENIYTNYKDSKASALKCAEKIKTWDWGLQNEKLLQIVCD